MSSISPPAKHLLADAETVQEDAVGSARDIRMVNACTVDVEDYFQVSAFEKTVDRKSWETLPSVVVSSTWRILELLEKHGVKATFFVLGWIARRHPDLVRAIDHHGHEIGCHSDMHRLVYTLSPAEFRRDLCQSLDSIQQAIGRRVRSYRSPSFSITQESIFALDILADEGIEIDSSIYPIIHDRYGIPTAPLCPHLIKTENGTITEFPATVFELGKMRLPVAGGGYFRFFPYRFTDYCIRSINRIGRPVNVYIHPWEFAPEQPRIAGVSRLSRFRHYVNLHRTYSRMDRILANHRFGTMKQSLESLTVPLPEYSAVEDGLDSSWQFHAPQGNGKPRGIASRIQSIIKCSNAT